MKTATQWCSTGEWWPSLSFEHMELAITLPPASGEALGRSTKKTKSPQKGANGKSTDAPLSCTVRVLSNGQSSTLGTLKLKDLLRYQSVGKTDSVPGRHVFTNLQALQRRNTFQNAP